MPDLSPIRKTGKIHWLYTDNYYKSDNYNTYNYMLDLLGLEPMSTSQCGVVLRIELQVKLPDGRTSSVSIINLWIVLFSTPFTKYILWISWWYKLCCELIIKSSKLHSVLLSKISLGNWNNFKEKNFAWRAILKGRILKTNII